MQQQAVPLQHAAALQRAAPLQLGGCCASSHRSHAAGRLANAQGPVDLVETHLFAEMKATYGCDFNGMAHAWNARIYAAEMQGTGPLIPPNTSSAEYIFPHALLFFEIRLSN